MGGNELLDSTYHVAGIQLYLIFMHKVSQTNKKDCCCKLFIFKFDKG